MNRLLVKTGILAGFVLMLSVVGNAQLSQQYRAEVPFDFQVKGVVYAAGSYAVGPVSSQSSSGALAILERKSGKMQLLGITQLLGASVGADPGKLVFVKANGTYTLRRIITPTFEIKMKAKGSDARMADSGAKKMETVAVALR